MKNPSAPLALLLASLCALPAVAGEWDDALAIDPASFRIAVNGEAPRGDAEIVGRGQPAVEPVDESRGPAYLYKVMAPFTRDDVAFSVLVGRAWNCRLEQVGNLWNGGGGGIRIPVPIVESRVTFSPRDRGLRRSAARPESVSGVALFSFAPADGMGGSLSDGRGGALETETIRYYRLPTPDGDIYQLMSRSVDASGRVRYWFCRAE
jgi:hypothetical protein